MRELDEVIVSKHSNYRWTLASGPRYMKFCQKEIRFIHNVAISLIYENSTAFFLHYIQILDVKMSYCVYGKYL